MKTFILITTIMFSTPDRDFTGVLVKEFDNEAACNVALQSQQDTYLSFGVMEVDIKNRCEEK